MMKMQGFVEEKQKVQFVIEVGLFTIVFVGVLFLADGLMGDDRRSLPSFQPQSGGSAGPVPAPVPLVKQPITPATPFIKEDVMFGLPEF